MAGKRIDDHKFWAGGSSKGSVLPETTKTTQTSSAEGCGGLMHYEDTTEQIKTQQNIGVSKAKKHSQREHYRY